MRAWSGTISTILDGVRAARPARRGPPRHRDRARPCADRLDRLAGGSAVGSRWCTAVFLLDEPTNARGRVVGVLEPVREIAAAGRTVVMVQHGLATADPPRRPPATLRDVIFVSSPPGPAARVRTRFTGDAARPWCRLCVW
ncbi:hypothetical protein [Actinoallomurus acaciae]|uniref:Uncharacterized protein n=1 Tax=Actinoallomurus acaciae TaxID=502577 RepID=A0ABV5YVQ9_9ACTN